MHPAHPARRHRHHHLGRRRQIDDQEDQQPAMDVCRNLQRRSRALQQDAICGCDARHRRRRQRSHRHAVRALTMARHARSLTLSAVLAAIASLSLLQSSTWAQSRSPTPVEECVECYPPTPTPSPPPTPTPSASPLPSPTSTPSTNAPPVAVTGSGAGSINDLAGQRFNQMITNHVLGNVLLGVNEQVNCNDCISAFGSAGSFSAGIHGRQNLTPNLSLLAGIAHTPDNESGYHVTSSPIAP